MGRDTGRPLLCVNQRDVSKEAFGDGSSARLRWTSKFGSVTFNQFGREFPLGGINEKGLVIEELSARMKYPPPDGRRGRNELQWTQYHLDTWRTAKEVLKSASSVRVSRLLIGLHYLVGDSKGNAAVIEFINGRTVSYSGDTLPVAVLSNDTYEQSLRVLKFYRGFGGERVVPGGPGSAERFVRAAANGKNPFTTDDKLSTLKNYCQSFAGILLINPQAMVEIVGGLF